MKKMGSVVAGAVMVAGLAFGQTVAEYKVDPVLTNVFPAEVWEQYEPADDAGKLAWYQEKHRAISRVMEAQTSSGLWTEAEFLGAMRAPLNATSLTGRQAVQLSAGDSTPSALTPESIVLSGPRISANDPVFVRWNGRLHEAYAAVAAGGFRMLDGSDAGPVTLSMYRFLYTGYSEAALQAFLFEMQPYVRRYMRGNGISIVVRADGSNPVAEYLQPVIDAVNAPMMTGLEAAVAAVGGPVIVVDRSMQPELEALRDSIWNGDIPASNATRAALRFLMGTEGYNAWAAAYNMQ